MNKARAVITCGRCGKRYDPEDFHWQTAYGKDGISFFVHDCQRWTIEFKTPLPEGMKLMADVNYVGEIGEEWYEQQT